MTRVTVDFNIGAVKQRHSEALSYTQFALDSQVLKDTNEFVPKDTSNLINSSLIHSKIGSGELIWSTPYARRLYYGTGMTFSKDRNAKASDLWFEHAKSQHKKSWLSVADKAFRGVF